MWEKFLDGTRQDITPRNSSDSIITNLNHKTSIIFRMLVGFGCIMTYTQFFTVFLKHFFKETELSFWPPNRNLAAAPCSLAIINMFEPIHIVYLDNYKFEV